MDQLECQSSSLHIADYIDFLHVQIAGKDFCKFQYIEVFKFEVVHLRDRFLKKVFLPV